MFLDANKLQIIKKEPTNDGVDIIKSEYPNLSELKFIKNGWFTRNETVVGYINNEYISQVEFLIKSAIDQYGADAIIGFGTTLGNLSTLENIKQLSIGSREMLNESTRMFVDKFFEDNSMETKEEENDDDTEMCDSDIGELPYELQM